MLVKKIDIHVHACLRKALQHQLDPTFYDFCTPEELRKKYEQWGIEKGVQLPVIKPEAGLRQISNEESYDMVQQHPDRFEWFCCIDPRMVLNHESTDFSGVLNSFKHFGAKGVGEMLCNLYFDDPLVWNLFRHAEKCQMPVIFHIGNRGLDYGLIDELGLPRLEKTLKEFPNLIFLGHSQKFWAEIGTCTEADRDGYPKGPVTPGRVVELMRKYPNLHGDLSAGSGGNAVMRDPDFGYAFMEEFQDRLYFGTDICDPRNEFALSKHLDDAVESGKLSQEAYNKICRENALRLLNGELYK